MVIIGLLLVALAAAAGIDAAAQNDVAFHAQAAGQSWTSSPAAFLAGGVVIGLVACVGLMLMVDGMRRARVRRAERREAKASHERLVELQRRDETVDLRDGTLAREQAAQRTENEDPASPRSSRSTLIGSRTSSM